MFLKPLMGGFMESPGYIVGPESGVVPGKKPKTYQQVFIAVAMLAAISVINLFLERIIQPSSLVFIYLIATTVSAFWLGTWPAIITSAAGLLVYEFLFTEPKFSFLMHHAQDVYNVTVYFVVAVIIIALIRTVQKQNLIVRYRLDRAAFVEDMSRDFLVMTPLELKEKPGESIREKALDVIGRIIITHTRKILDVPVFVAFRQANAPLAARVKSEPGLEIGQVDLDCAYRAISGGVVTGAGAEPGAKTAFFFIPLKSHELAIGAVGIHYDYRKLSAEQQSLLRALTNLASMVAERWAAE
jgi:two-component system sensor histidine kinase KdpD